MPCKVPSCYDTVWAKGYCRFHDDRARRGIPLDKPKHFKVLEKTGWEHKGYRWVSTECGEVMEHRYLMELHLGRRLHVDEIVHHINGDKLDNRLENLEVMDRAEHTSQHRKHNLGCIWCGTYDPHGSRGVCAKHLSRVGSFLRSVGISVPTNEELKFMLHVAIALMLADADGHVLDRMTALQLDAEVHTRYARQRNRSNQRKAHAGGRGERGSGGPKR